VTPELEIPAPLARQIEAEGVSTFPNECCGIMIGRDMRDGDRVRRIVDRLVPMPNAFDPVEQYHRFTVDPAAQIRAEKEADAEGKLVLGYYHSHPNAPARPSEYDRQHAWPFFSYVIVSIQMGEPVDMTSWVLDDATETFQRQNIREI